MVRAFTVTLEDIQRCPKQSLLPSHYRDDATRTCLCRNEEGTIVVHNWAWTWLVEEEGYTLGRVERDKPGYAPLRKPRQHWATQDEVKARVRTLNEAEGVSEEEALEIVTSSIRAQNVRDRMAEELS
jgi:hypothetical protein